MTDTYAIRASSLAELFDCPARWAAKHLEGKRSPTSGAAHLGTSVHASTAAYDSARHITRNPISIDHAIGVALEKMDNPEEEVAWQDISKRDASNAAVLLTSRYCNAIAPRMNYRAVEVKCDDLILDMSDGPHAVPGIHLKLTGTVDRVAVVYNPNYDGHRVIDVKTGKQAVKPDGTVETKMHGAQLGQYELLEIMAARKTGIEITDPPQIIGLQTTKDARFGVGTLDTPPSQILLGDEHTPGLLHHAARMLKSGDFYGNPRSMLCSERYCPAWDGCRWRFPST